MTAFHIVIPARLGSTRLPRKVLRAIHGKPLVQWTWEAARRVGAASVVIATDDAEVLAACRAFGADVRMTDAGHPSGTDRANEIARATGWASDAIVVNVQGDEPLMPAAMIGEVARLLADDAEADIATLAHPLHAREDWLNPNFVKVVMDGRGRALYFSRAPIAWWRDGFVDGLGPDAPLPNDPAPLRHVGLYAYRVGFLKQFPQLPPAPLERSESLEQLRVLWHGQRIAVHVSDERPGPGVDTPEDLARVRQHFASA